MGSCPNALTPCMRPGSYLNRARARPVGTSHETLNELDWTAILRWLGSVNWLPLSMTTQKLKCSTVGQHGIRLPHRHAFKISQPCLSQVNSTASASFREARYSAQSSFWICARVEPGSAMCRPSRALPCGIRFPSAGALGSIISRLRRSERRAVPDLAVSKRNVFSACNVTALGIIRLGLREHLDSLRMNQARIRAFVHSRLTVRHGGGVLQMTDRA